LVAIRFYEIIKTVNLHIKLILACGF